MSYLDNPIEEIHDTIVASLKAFFKRTGVKRTVLGLSGGLDSAVVAALAAEALGCDNVHGILMPSPYSTLHSISDAVDLCNNLNIKYDVIPIEKIYFRYMRDIAPIFAGNFQWDNTQENLQARIRGTILMAYSNRKGALLLNTSNKSELSCGYGTLYGDLAGSLMVIADVYKLQVYRLAAYLNAGEEQVPVHTIEKQPSAELRDGQKDTDSLPPYSLLDPVLCALNDDGLTPEEIKASGVDASLVDTVVKMKKAASFKVHQMPQIIKVSDHPLLPCSKWVTPEY
ncbi:MAG: NAD(+) synthase [Alistipes sp.]|nr:NAD(+) synthase [Candidatus Minthomonas equi]